MDSNQEKMALWLAFTVETFTADEIEILARVLQVKVKEITTIVDNSNHRKNLKRSPYRDGDWFESCKSDDHD